MAAKKPNPRNQVKAAATRQRAQAAAAQDDGLVIVIALQPIRHNGKDFAEGDSLAVDADTAHALIEIGMASVEATAEADDDLQAPTGAN